MITSVRLGMAASRTPAGTIATLRASRERRLHDVTQRRHRVGTPCWLHRISEPRGDAALGRGGSASLFQPVGVRGRGVYDQGSTDSNRHRVDSEDVADESTDMGMRRATRIALVDRMDVLADVG